MLFKSLGIDTRHPITYTLLGRHNYNKMLRINISLLTFSKKPLQKFARAHPRIKPGSLEPEASVLTTKRRLI